jgi:hypothetical protein
MLWIKVSSRSKISVFWARLPLEASGKVYEGCRRGSRGLGGAGARGYFVIISEAEGEVGDFNVAGKISVDEVAPAPLLWEFIDWVLRCFRCRTGSSA